MPRGKAIPPEKRFPNPVKFSAVIDGETKFQIDMISGELVSEFGFIPTQGQTVDFIVKYFQNNKEKKR